MSSPLVPSSSECVPPSLPSERMSTSLPRGAGPATRAGIAPGLICRVRPSVPGVGLKAGGAGTVPTRAPHAPQNRNPVGTSLPHEGHGLPGSGAAGASGGAVTAVGSTRAEPTGRLVVVRHDRRALADHLREPASRPHRHVVPAEDPGSLLVRGVAD